ncbi:LPS-assembly protein LptD [Pseudoponticoccus marisrubri]|uniref:LPS-assembly protein LptD n=1 Tax=Pseudoponticoccus marisrubri TaxID=1685382 RepID=A0A0W7WN76_9RHOB|nr:LPS assembly protein LptD [Pseudoponticoccus marisrubri]KUF11956.1 organic solvent tolerance protein [Pseudoponticoccus marisrubri]
MRALLSLLLALALALPAQAQTQAQTDETADAALLVADQVFVEGEERLVATGNVEALQGDTRLTATRITYDGTTDTLSIDGPIRIVDPAGNVLVADQAELDQELTNGLLVGARLVLDQQLQLASVEARRVEGRYTQLSKVAVTSCQVCADSGPPLWQIRARRVVHDQEERQLYFDGAQFRVLDIPIAYIPRLRLPDPTLERARGFMIPSVRSSSLLGFGIKIPYFIPIGDHQDITLTPYLARESRTLEFRYRRAFYRGDLTVTGAISDDTLMPDTARGYLFAEGAFRLENDYQLEFDLAAVSDISYLNDYGVAGGDRLDSTLSLTRIRPDVFFQTNLVHYQSLRASEDNDTQPTLVGDIRYERRHFLDRLGGELRLTGEAHTHYRWSSLNVDGPDADTEVDGRDVARVNAEISWRDRWTLPGGLRAGLSTHLWLDHYSTRQDATSAAEVSRATPGVAVELRWPFQRQGASGGRTLIEPVVQMGWVGGSRPRNPNDESTRVEFDEANLLSLSRFPAADRREHGATLAAGLRWMHRAPAGWTTALTLGKLWREDTDPEFSRSSGLEGEESDWLLAGRFAHPVGLTLSVRGLLDREARLSKGEARAGWSNARMDLGASYLLLVTDADEDRATAQSEWTFDGLWRVNERWSTSLEARYDLADARLDRTGIGLQYQNECVQVDFSASRSYASATNLEPSTDFDLTVALKGFSTGGSAKEYRRSCDQ